MSGELLALIDPNPLTIMPDPLPGCPLPDVVITPDICPSSILETSATGLSRNLSPLIVSAEPVNDSLDAVPYATTSTSSRTFTSAVIATLIVVRPFTAMVCSCIPRHENTNVASEGTDMEYFPSMSVIEWLLPSFSRTATPAKNISHLTGD